MSEDKKLTKKKNKMSDQVAKINIEVKADLESKYPNQLYFQVDFYGNNIMNAQDAVELLEVGEYDLIDFYPATPGLGSPRPKKPRP